MNSLKSTCRIFEWELAVSTLDCSEIGLTRAGCKCALSFFVFPYQQLRKLVLEIIHRIPTNEHLRPHTKNVLSVMFRFLEVTFGGVTSSWGAVSETCSDSFCRGKKNQCSTAAVSLRF